MRLAAQAKAGFYPAHPKAIEGIAAHLKCRPPDPNKKYDTCTALDPCSGKGLAIHQLTQAIGIPEEQVYTVELDPERSKEVAKLMPAHHHLGPASFFGVQITGFSFGLAYVNPPFDVELGGGRREELRFVQEVTRLLVPKGILVLVVPVSALSGNRQFVDWLDAHFEETALYKFPDGNDEETGQPIRPYREMVVIAKKRASPLPQELLYQNGCLRKMGFSWNIYIDRLPPIGGVQPTYWNDGVAGYDREPAPRVWEIPHAWKPHVFKKTAFTDAELEAVISESPLGRILKEVVVPPPNAPPLPLDRGHLGLILASGILDGVVEGPHGVHVVRGSSHKVMYHNKEASCSEENPDTGAVTTKDVFSERMVTVIRAVEQDGVIRTYDNEPKEKDKDDEGSD